MDALQWLRSAPQKDVLEALKVFSHLYGGHGILVSNTDFRRLINLLVPELSNCGRMTPQELNQYGASLDKCLWTGLSGVQKLAMVFHLCQIGRPILPLHQPQIDLLGQYGFVTYRGGSWWAVKEVA